MTKKACELYGERECRYDSELDAAFHAYLVVEWEGNIAKPVVLDMIPPYIQPFPCP